MLRIRLTRRGRRHSPSYRIVVSPSNASRDGRAVSDLGYYNPNPDPSDIQVDLVAARDWIVKGAQPSDRVWKILEIAEPGFKQSIGSKNGAVTAVATPQAAPKSAAEPAAATVKAAPKAGAKKATAKPAAKGRAKATAKASTKKIAPKSKAKSRAK